VTETGPCPECGRTRIYKDGWRPLNDGISIQRYKCATCGRRFDDNLITNRVHGGHSQVCVVKKAKNLDTAQEIKTCAEKWKHTPTENEIRATPQIEKLLSQLKGDGRTEGTLLNYRKTFKRLLKAGADMFNPENTKLVLADLTLENGKPIGNNTKKTMAAILDVWYDFNEIKWKPPKYAKEEKPIWIPPTGLLAQFTAAMGKKMCCYCMLLMATGARCGEVSSLELKDFDFAQQKVNITPEKGSNPRTLSLQKHPEILGMVKKLPANKNPLRNNKLFSTADDMRSNFFLQRKRASQKFQNSDMLKIHFHTYRHWHATMAQRQLHDKGYVQMILGHKYSQSTDRYTNLAIAYGDTTTDEYETRVADTLKEAQSLVEVGFEYHLEVEGHKLFRRKKEYNGLSW
jgi:integrase